MATEYRPEPEMMERCIRALSEARAVASNDSLPRVYFADEAMVRAVLVEASAYMKEPRKRPRGRNGGRKNKLGVPRPPEFPKKAWRAMLAHMKHAELRGIPFKMSPDEWWAWWQQDGRWERRGLGKDKLCMARTGDVGPYAIGNVYCATNAQNYRDAQINGRMAENPGGRRKKLSDQDVEQAKSLLTDGSVTFKEVAKRFGVCRDVLYDYLPGGRSAYQLEPRP